MRSMVRHALVIALLSFQVTGQMTIPFKVASNDRSAAFWHDNWAVMGEITGELYIDKNNRWIKGKVFDGYLLSEKAQRNDVSILAMLATRANKNFTWATVSDLRHFVIKRLKADRKTKIQRHEFQLKLPQTFTFSETWLAFEIRFSCDLPKPGSYCFAYMHSRSDIFIY